MALGASDLGVAASLAEALGLTQGGTFRDDWLADPGKYLARMLADKPQRDALVAFIDEVLAGEDRSTGPDGATWLPIVRTVAGTQPDVRTYLVVDDRPATYVAIGAAVKVTSQNPAASVSAQVPLFRAAKTGHSVPNALLLGTPEGMAAVTVDITTNANPPTPGQAHLGGIALSLTVPTAAGTAPDFSLRLRQLQMPGASTASDLALSVQDLASLQNSALELVLGLVRAQADALPTGPLAALAGLLGLRQGSTVAPLPLAAIARDGLPALAQWFSSVLAGSAATAWWGELSTLLTGNTSAVDGAAIAFALGPLRLRVAVNAHPGANGLVRIEPVVSITWPAQAGVHLAARAVLCSIDLGNGQAVALPSMSLNLLLGQAAGGAVLLDVSAPTAMRVPSLRLGLGLNAQRQPVLDLAALAVRIDGREHGDLDLSNPEAVAQVGATVVGALIDDVFDRLGPAEDAVRLLLGVAPPAVPAGIVPLDVGRFLQDPLAALRGYWQALLRDHPSAVQSLLVALRDVIADATHVADTVSGDGSVAQPWRLNLAGPLALLVHVDAGHLLLRPTLRLVVDQLGQRCTVLQTDLSCTLLDLDVNAPSAQFLTEVGASLQLRARGRPEAVLPLGVLELRAEQIALAARWSPARGLAVDLQAPGLQLHGVPGVEPLPVPLPRLNSAGRIVLDAAGWQALEDVLGAFGRALAPPWLDLLLGLAGWAPRPNAVLGQVRARLDLQALAADSRPALVAWLRDVIAHDAQALQQGLAALADGLNGARDGVAAALAGTLRGRGHPDDPWRVGLSRSEASAELLLWLGPEGPPESLAAVAEAVQAWQPGVPGVSSEVLARSLAGLSRGAGDVADLMAGREGLASGLDALVARWAGSDGIVLPPLAPPAGVQVHTRAELARADLMNGLDADGVQALLGSTPAVVVHVTSAASLATASPWIDVSAGRSVDLTALGLAAAALTLPTVASSAGEWWVVLGPRDACRRSSGDEDGVLGQADRLARFLRSLTGPVTVVADGRAGAAARVACEAVSAVQALVCGGAALSPVSLAVLDESAAGDALRLLARLLPAEPAADDESAAAPNADLQLARALLQPLVAAMAEDDPVRELRPPGGLGAPRAGLAVHMVYGVLGEAAVRRALTAVVSAALSARRPSGAAASPDTLVVALRTAVALPAAAGGVQLNGRADLVLGQWQVDGSGITHTAPRDVRLHLALGRANGWLLGGPDAGRSAGQPRPHELRRVSMDVRVPLAAGAPAASVHLTLHDARVFELSRERWRLQAADAPSLLPRFDAATTVLPEARVLLAGLAQSLAAHSDAASQTLRALWQSLGWLDAAGASVPAAIEHALNDPQAHLQALLTDPAARALVLQGLRGLWPGLALPDALPDELGVQLGPLAARLRLQPWRLTLQARAEAGGVTGGLLSWQAQMQLDANGLQGAQLALGAGLQTGIGGGINITLDQALQLALAWQRPGAPEPERIALWPTPNVAALESTLTRLLPAELLRHLFENLRGLDETAQPVIDAVLSLLGVLAPANAAGQRRVRLPLGLLTDPAGWLAHADALGLAGGGFNPARLVSLVDALKPLVGVTGPAGVWQITPGLQLEVQAVGSAARLALAIDSRAMSLPPAAAGRLAFGGSVQLLLPGSGALRPGLALHLGLPGAGEGRSAVHVELLDQLRLFIRPAAGADVALFPQPASLGALVTTAVTQALPLVLDALADLQSQPSPQREIGRVVAQLGDAMALRSGGRFQAAALTAWGQNPAAQLALRWPALVASALQTLAAALDEVLPAGTGAVWNGTAIMLTAGGLTITLTPSPFALTVQGRLNSLPVIDTAFARVGLNAAGLQELVIDVGPADIDMAGVSLRPQFNIVAGLAHVSDASSALLLGLPGDRAVGVRWLIGQRLDLVLRNGATEITAPDQVALGLLEAVLDIVASFVLRVPEVARLLGKPVGASTVRAVLDDALLVAASSPPRLVSQPFDLTLVLPRLQRLALNIARARPSITIDGALTLGLAAETVGINELVALTLDLPRPAILLSGDITISLESDARWIRMPSGAPPAQGLVVQLLQVGPGLASFTFAPGLQVNGLGVRVARREQPLIASDVLSLGSIALHVFARVDAGGRAGGAQLQLSSLSVAPAGAGGGNGVAKGVLADAGSGSDRLAPTFSPALAVQKHGNDGILVNLRAGDGAGPWWLSIQRGFGPVYIEQVGFGVTERNNTLQKISLLLDGRVSLFGLTAAVDDLQLTHTVASDASVFSASRWEVDLAGLAFNADLGGIFLQGGLRKFGDGQNARYVGMLMGRFAVYGLSVFGGYGQGEADGQKFSSFFAFGAINGPIGGPPAFFLTGIGGGLGINRALLMPPDMSQFGNYPFIKALDPAARPSTDPMAELLALETLFPMKRGNFWFAAGVSFTSFALIDGVAVLSIQIGDGLEVALMGLARMALPRPQLPIVSIELGLIARFSSKEGVLWVQAQLTDNSWLLYPDVRLTGGFAFVVWFAGPNAGQFVLTIGGYHPNFRRAGYPMVPRLGLVWRLGEFITIKGESYFALTSEALMAGLRVEVSARFGPAWAQVIFGADGIVFFDPFYFQVIAYASISAGITIDVWIGEITISISIGANIMVEGPEFHGIATFSVGPVELEVEFGERNQPPRPPLPWDAFVRKYLEEAAPARARALAAIAGKGAVTPGTGPGGATDTGTADGTAAKPFEVYAECEITLTSTVPLASIDLGGRVIAHTPSDALSVAPMRIEGVDTVLRIDLLRKSDGASFTAGLKPRQHVSPSFPYGVWGPPQDPGKPKVPEGKVITALDGLTLISEATIPPGSAPIDYRRVETAIATTNHPRTRHPLPFVSEARERAARLTQARTLAQALPGAEVQNDDQAVLRVAAQWSERAGGSRTAAHALKGLRAAPPRLGSLSEGLANVAAPLTAVSLPPLRVTGEVNTTVQRPRAIGVLTLGIDEPERVPERTTVRRPPEGALRQANPPTVAQVQAEVDAAVPAVLKLVSTTRGATQGRTVIAADSAPLTRVARAPLAAVRGRGATRDVFERLKSLNGALQRKAGARGATPVGAQVASGEVAVFELPNARRDVGEGPRPALTVVGQSARVVMLAAGGALLADVEVGGAQAAGVIVPKGAHHIAVAVGLPGAAQRAGLAGWHSGAMLPMVGHQSALAAEAIVQCEGRVRSVQQRGLVREAGWLRGADLVEGAALVHTRFTHDVTQVAVVLDDPTVSPQNAGRRALSVSWDGAQVAVDANGEPLAPLAVVRGQRVALIYTLLPDPGIEGVGVSLASQEDWHLVGVVAARAGDSAQTLANQLANGELDQLVRGPVVGDVGLATLGWRTAEEQQRMQPRSTPRRPPRVKATPKRKRS